MASLLLGVPVFANALLYRRCDSGEMVLLAVAVFRSLHSLLPSFSVNLGLQEQLKVFHTFAESALASWADMNGRTVLNRAQIVMLLVALG